MEEAIHVINPISKENLIFFWIGLIVSIGSITGMVVVLKQKRNYQEKNKQMLIAMLLFFVFLISISTTFFSFWAHLKIGPVRIEANAIETAYGKTAFKDIKKITFHESNQPSMINPNISRNSVRILLIEERSGKIHALSEENYNINSIMQKLNKAIKDSQEEN